MNEKIDSDREIEDAIELFEQVGYSVQSKDLEGGDSRLSSTSPPSFASIRKLKRKHMDYRAGPVKHYTREEIEEYENVRILRSDRTKDNT